MAKIITDKELLEIVSKAINEDLIDDADTYLRFLKDMTGVVADYFGGKAGECGMEDGECHCAVHLSEEVPDDGGVYKDYDKDVIWKNGEEKEVYNG